jgi:hypothetical protein
MDRRSFIVSAACAFLTPSFLKDATRIIEHTSSPLLVAPDNPTRTVFALRGKNPTGPGYFYDLWLDSPEADMNEDFFYMSWREFLRAKGYGAQGGDRALAKLLLDDYNRHLNLNGETQREWLAESRAKLDEPADEDFLFDEWKSWGSPQGKAYNALYHLDLGPDPRLRHGAGSVEFIDSPSLGYSACSVEVEGCMSLSLLQGRLNELGTGFQIELRVL